MRPALFAFLAAAVGCASAANSAGEPAAELGSLRAIGLACDDSLDPLGIDEALPRLSWRVAGERRGERQLAWRVLVASSPEALQRDQGDLWDSGRIASDQTTNVTYGGAALFSSQRVYWKVRTWDRDERPSPWSAPASWTMGLLTPVDWKAAWIAAPGATESLLLRSEFSVQKELRRAVLYACGLGHYELGLNGAKVGEDLLSPGWTNYDRTTLYDTRDVTAFLRKGRNAVGLMLGNGMYDVVRRDRFVKFTGFFGPLRAILQLRLEYADGTVQFVGTDATWRTRAGPITSGNIYSGEDYDARLEPVGWLQPDFDDRAWPRAVPVLGLGGTLIGHRAAAEPLRAIETHRPVAERSFPDGSVVYDLGQNASHMPRLQVTGPAGSTVRLTPAEVVNADGTINRVTMGGKNRGDAWWQYTKATDGEETWFPRFYYAGCRYLKAEFFASEQAPAARDPGADAGPAAHALPVPAVADSGRRPRLKSLEGVVVHSSASSVGHFATSNERLNRIHDLVRWAQRSNMVSVFTDCPHREKLGWLEQYHLNGPSIRYEFDTRRIFAKGLHDMADAQDESGLVPNIAPEFVRFQGAFRSAAEWGAAFFLVPWQQYLFTGDCDLFRTHYDAMRRYFSYLETRTQDDILADGLGDWFDLGPDRPGPAQLTPPPVTASAFYYWDATVLAKVAALLGRAADAQDYAGRAARIRTSYNRHFFHSDNGSYATGSQCANALPLVIGLVPSADRGRVLSALVRDVESHGGMMTTGDVGFRFLLLALAENGRSDLIYRMIDQDDRPGYGYQLKQGATSLTESWDANLANSQDHFMLGQVMEWFYRYLAGIDTDPDGPGFKRIFIQPQPVGDLRWVDAAYNSIRGPISVRWERQADRFRLTVEIPANTTATIQVPARAGAPVTEGGVSAERSPGVTFLRRTDDRAAYSIGSGRYDFESRW